MGLIWIKKMKHEPKPLVEEHYYIQHLIEAQEKRAADRTRHQDREKARNERTNDIAGFKDIELLDFFCTQCDRDFIGRAKKQVDSWEQIAYYKIKHTCGKWCIRHITDRFRDLYFFKSKKVARDRGRMAIDALQPFQSGYNMIYGKK